MAERFSFEAAFETWRKRVEAGERDATMLELYEAVAAARGVSAHELPIDERRRIWERAMPVAWPGYAITPGSERSDPDMIRLVPSDPSWAVRFVAWQEEIKRVLGPVARRVDHVGSTAVPGLPAKPILDIDVAVDDLSREELYVAPLESLGVQLRSRDDSHRYFRPFAGRPRDVHVHVSRYGSDFERRHLLFVAYLRAHSSARGRYLEAKRQAAARWRGDGLAYTEAKTACISRLMEEAERWAAQTGWTLQGAA